MKDNAGMSIKEAERLSVIRQVDKKILTLLESRKELGLSLKTDKEGEKKISRARRRRTYFPKAWEGEQSKDLSGSSK
jgi:hypothetical protein